MFWSVSIMIFFISCLCWKPIQKTNIQWKRFDLSEVRKAIWNTLFPVDLNFCNFFAIFQRERVHDLDKKHIKNIWSVSYAYNIWDRDKMTNNLHFFLELTLLFWFKFHYLTEIQPATAITTQPNKVSKNRNTTEYEESNMKYKILENKSKDWLSIF